MFSNVECFGSLCKTIPKEDVDNSTQPIHAKRKGSSPREETLSWVRGHPSIKTDNIQHSMAGDRQPGEASLVFLFEVHMHTAPTRDVIKAHHQRACPNEACSD